MIARYLAAPTQIIVRCMTRQKPFSILYESNRLLVLFTIFTGRTADIGFEYPRKTAGGEKVEVRTNGGQGLIRIAEKALCFLRFFFQDEVGQRFSRFLLKTLPCRNLKKPGCQLLRLPLSYPTGCTDSAPDRSEASAPDRRAYFRALLCSNTVGSG